MIFLLQGVEQNWFDKYGWVIVLLVITNLVSSSISYIFNRRPQQASSAKLDAETMSSLLKTINELRINNDELFKKFANIRDEVDKVGDLLETTKGHLTDCKEALREAVERLEKVKIFLGGIKKNGGLLNDLQLLTDKLKAKLEDTYNQKS